MGLQFFDIWRKTKGDVFFETCCSRAQSCSDGARW